MNATLELAPTSAQEACIDPVIEAFHTLGIPRYTNESVKTFMDKMYIEVNDQEEERREVLRQKSRADGTTEPPFVLLQWRYRSLEKWLPRPVPSWVMDMVVALSERLPGHGFLVYDFGEDPFISLVEPIKDGESVQKEHFFAHWDEVGFKPTEQSDTGYSI